LNGTQSKPKEASWYDSCLRAFTRDNDDFSVKTEAWKHDEAYMLPETEPLIYIHETEQEHEVNIKNAAQLTKQKFKLPEWVTSPLPKERTPPRVLKPSQDNEAVPVRSPLDAHDESYRYKRGLLTHSLLQYLPDIAPENREQAAHNFMTLKATDIAENIRQSIITETLAILNNENFKPFFGQGSLAEVPVTGTVTHADGKIDIISGQIDRMLITDSHIWIIDFKSNRPPPREPHDIPNQYRKQLKAYKALISQLYPEHIIKCALLWTDGPFMMELNNI
jgi:ATP-dependent helicase/nuclease subunit A